MMTLGKASGREAVNVKVFLKDSDKGWTVAGRLGNALWLHPHTKKC